MVKIRARVRNSGLGFEEHGLKDKSEREKKGTNLLRDFCLKERAKEGVREKN
jgi:hypothetical protein